MCFIISSCWCSISKNQSKGWSVLNSNLNRTVGLFSVPSTCLRTTGLAFHISVPWLQVLVNIPSKLCTTVENFDSPDIVSQNFWVGFVWYLMLLKQSCLHQTIYNTICWGWFNLPKKVERKKQQNKLSYLCTNKHLMWWAESVRSTFPRVYLLYLQEWFKLEAISPLSSISLHVLIFPWVLFYWFQEKKRILLFLSQKWDTLSLHMSYLHAVTFGDHKYVYC